MIHQSIALLIFATIASLSLRPHRSSLREMSISNPHQLSRPEDAAYKFNSIKFEFDEFVYFARGKQHSDCFSNKYHNYYVTS